jgi:diacylglycerol kinase
MERVCSIFSQIMQMIPRGLFDEAVAKHEGEKHAKGMTCRSQLVSLLFAHLGHARSLREITQGLAASEGKLKHLGVERAPTKSTLAYANEHRPWPIYKDLFEGMAALCQTEARDKKRRFKFKNPLVSLDSTVIPLCLSMYDWASYTRTKGAVKLHLLLDNATLLPQYAVLSNGKTADVTMAKKMTFAPGTILAMDRGYEDHKWWRRLTADKVYFVTRLKDSTAYLPVETIQEGDGSSQLLRDEIVVLAKEADSPDAMRLRRIEVMSDDGESTLVFITNNLKLAASTIAAIYRDRWKIELFFKALKQSMRIKTFIGTSENAVQIQIWTALLAILLVRFLQLRSTWNWSLSNLFALLRQQLFVYRNLWLWLNEPCRPPFDDLPSDDPQMALPLQA